MANSLKLWEVFNVIRNNEDRWRQSTWSDGLTNPAATNYTECNTTFCVAGWGARLNGWKPVVQRLFNGNYVAQGNLFVPVTNPVEHTVIDGLSEEDIGAESAREIAMDVFELTDHEADELFDGTSCLDEYGEESVYELEKLISSIINGDVCARSGTGTRCLGYCRDYHYDNEI